MTYRRISRLALASSLGEALGGALAPLAPDDQALHTRSTRLEKPGFFARLLGSADPDEEHETALVLGPSALRVAIAGRARGTHSMVLPYATLSIATLSIATMSRLAAAGAVELGPHVTLNSPSLGASVNGVASYTVFFGPEPEAAAFVERLRARLV